MKSLLVPTIAALLLSCNTAAHADASGAGVSSADQCSVAHLTGVGGSVQSLREYLAAPDRDRVRYVIDHPVQCKVSDDGRASDCTGLDSFRNEPVSVYDDIDSNMMSVVVRVDLDHGTAPAILAVLKKDLHCDQ
ncbi:hypothetical protein [Paraburkholderia ferrariae]|uniref:hypothetical protein n=1 Tax=Paraburkholderia ferrariae TaxID=386056 RepID=UPI00047F8FCA|nr:hypothetical protein [Paraburkholderia ferrariae]